MRRVVILSLMLLLGQGAYAQVALTLQQEIDRNPGDFAVAVKHLGNMLKSRNFLVYGFAISRPSELEHYAAKRILSLERMGKISVHSPQLKNAFIYEFLMTYQDPAHRHEALALYQRLAVPNAADPYWRIVRARCARLMDLPETLQLYEQVAADMAGVPPNDEVRKLWDANREEFDLPGYTKDTWRKQTTRFNSVGRGPDVPGSLTIPANLLPLLDLEGAVASKATDWETALDDPSNTSAKKLDGFYAQTKKFGELPWRDGRGFLNTEQVLARQWLSQPPEALAELRDVQEAGFNKVTRSGVDPGGELARFRRFPWSTSAQTILLKLAQRHVFEGKPQAAYRGFQDVLRHAEAKELREQAQVGLWVSLAQFADASAVAKSFDGVGPATTWPWYGKREKTDRIKEQLVGQTLPPVTDKTGQSAHPTEEQSPTLASLKLHTVRLPPVRITRRNEPVLRMDMQREGNQLLVSNPWILAMYAANNPAKPLWIQRKGAGGGKALFVGQHVVAPWVTEHRLVALRRSDGTIVGEGDPHDPHTHYRYQTIGGPVIADGMAYAVQLTQSNFRNIWGGLRRDKEVALSCFGKRDLKHLWTRSYETTWMNEVYFLTKLDSVLPRVSHGAVYFCTNAGHVIRADCRDGEMEWVHFFRPGSTIDKKPASPWCLGARPIVTDDKVICMPKYTGYLFALDKATGRRLWRTPLLEGREVLGMHENLVLVVGANCLYAVDVNTGKLRWARQISEDYIDGFQLPRPQMIGSSIYFGTKNTLYRFHAGSGALQESRDWAMGGEVPMSFLISGTDLYAISDLPLRDAAFERQLVEYHTVIHPAAKHNGTLGPLKQKDGSVVFWRDGMLVCVKGDKVLWSRFVSFSHDNVYICGMAATVNGIRLGWPKGSAIHHATTGGMLKMGTVQIKKK